MAAEEDATAYATRPLKKSGGVLAAGFKGCAGAKSGSTGFGIGVSPTLTTQLQTHTVYALQGNGIDRADTAGCNGCGWREGQMYTLNTVDRPAIAATCGSFMQYGWVATPTLMARDYKDPQFVRYERKGGDKAVKAVIYPGVGITSPQNGNNPKPGSPAPTLTNDNRNYLVQECGINIFENHAQDSRFRGPVDVSQTVSATWGMGGNNTPFAVENGEKQQRKYIVRRLTPTECARLQGFPDEWCEGLGGSDNAIYKAYGNGLALPCAYDVLRRIAKEYDQTTL